MDWQVTAKATKIRRLKDFLLCGSYTTLLHHLHAYTHCLCVVLCGIVDVYLED